MCSFAVPKETPTIKYSTHRQNPAHAVHISSIGCVFVLLARHSTIIVNNPIYLQWIQSVVEPGGVLAQDEISPSPLHVRAYECAKIS